MEIIRSRVITGVRAAAHRPVVADRSGLFRTARFPQTDANDAHAKCRLSSGGNVRVCVRVLLTFQCSAVFKTTPKGRVRYKRNFRSGFDLGRRLVLRLVKLSAPAPDIFTS